MTPDKYGGVIDDLRTAKKWSHILPLLRQFEDAQRTVDNLKAIEEIAAFCIVRIKREALSQYGISDIRVY